MTDYLSYPGARGATAVAVLCGALLALVGIPLVLRRRAFTGVALAEAAALGTSLGSWLGTPKYLMPLVMTVGALVLLEFATSRRSGEDGLVALCYLAAASGATLFVSKLPGGEADMMTLSFGNLLAVTRRDVQVSIGVAVVSVALLSRLFRPLLATLNDPLSARAAGIPAPGVRLAYAALLAVAVTTGLSLFGVVPVVAYLVTPPFVGLRMASSPRGWGTMAIVTALVASILGLILSFAWDFPPGPFVASLLACAGFCAWVARR